MGVTEYMGYMGKEKKKGGVLVPQIMHRTK